MLSGTSNTNQERMTLVCCYDSSDLTAMLHGVVEKHEVHGGKEVVVLSQSELESLSKLFDVLELIVKFLIKATNKVSEDEWLRVLFGEVL